MRSNIIVLALSIIAHGAAAARLSRQADCEIIRIEPTNGCSQLADRCGISREELIEYNSHRDSLCTTLLIGQPICCTPGDLPGVPGNPDGTCKTIDVGDRDNCEKLAGECGISIGELIRFNDGAVNFCVAGLFAGATLCCTEGDLPSSDGGANPPDNDDPCPTHAVE